MRFESTSLRLCRYLPAATTSWYSVAPRPRVPGFSKRPAVANPAAVVQRQDDVSSAREILIHGIGVRGSSTCNASRAAVWRIGPPCRKMRAGCFSPGFKFLGTKNLCVQLDSVRRLEDGWIHGRQLKSRSKILRPCLRGQGARHTIRARVVTYGRAGSAAPDPK